MVDLNRYFSPRRFGRGPQAPNLSDSPGSAQGLKKIGEAISQVSLAFGEELKKEETLNFVENSTREYKAKMHETLNQMKGQYGESDLSKFKEDFDARAKELQEAYFENSPNGDARNAFFSRSNNVRSNFGISAQDYVFGEKVKIQKKGYQDSVNSMSSSLSSGLNLADGIQDLNEFSLQVEKSNLFTPSEKITVQEKAKQQMAESYLRGIESKELYHKGLKFFGGGSEFEKSLTEEQKRSWQNRFQSGIERKKQENFLILNNNAKLAIKSVEGGTESPAILDQMFSSVDATDLDADKKEALKGELALAKINREMEDALSLLSPEERGNADFQTRFDSIIKDFKVRNPLMKSAIEAETKKDISQFSAKLDREFNADPVTYFSKRDKTLSDLAQRVVGRDANGFVEYKAKLDSHYDRFKTPQSERKYLSKPMSDRFKGDINGFLKEGKYEEAANVFSEIEQLAGDNKFDILNDLGMGQYSAVGEPNNVEAKARMMMNMDKEVVSRVERAFKDKGLKDKDARERLVKNPLYTGYLLHGGGGEQAKQNASDVLDHVTREYKRLVSEEGMAESAASDEAWRLFGNTYNTVTWGRRHSVIVPKGVDGENVQGYIRYRDKNWENTINELNIKTDDKLDIKDHAEDLKNRGVWTTSPDRSGMTLYVFDVGGLSRVMNKDGEQVSIKFDDIKNQNFKNLPDDPLEDKFSEMTKFFLEGGSGFSDKRKGRLR